MGCFNIAINWGLKEPNYSCSPYLPSLNEDLPHDLSLLEDIVACRHSYFGTETSFYWCFPFWCLAARLSQKNIALAGLTEFILSGLEPDLILQVDLPLQRKDFVRLCRKYPSVPKILLVAETPLERHAQHSNQNLSDFVSVLSYSKSMLQVVQANLPFRFHKPPCVKSLRLKPSTNRTYLCSYVGNAHSSGWRRNYQYSLGITGWPLIWQYLQGWSLPLTAAWRDETFGAYGIRTAAVLAAQKLLQQRFYLSGRGWDTGGSGWFTRYFPDRRLDLSTRSLGMYPGAKVELLCNSTFTLACENYLGDSGYVSEKVFDAMAAGSIPIYIGAPDSLPSQLNNVVVDLSSIPRRQLQSSFKLTRVLKEIFAMPEHELLRRQQACLNFMDQNYEKLSGLEPFFKAFDDVLDDLVPCASC